MREHLRPWRTNKGALANSLVSHLEYLTFSGHWNLKQLDPTADRSACLHMGHANTWDMPKGLMDTGFVYLIIVA